MKIQTLLFVTLLLNACGPQQVDSRHGFHQGSSEIDQSNILNNSNSDGSTSNTNDNGGTNNTNNDGGSGDATPVTPETCPKFPVVFLHGLMGGSRGSFIGVIKHFQSLGCKVLLPEVSPVNSSEFRAAQVVEKIKTFLSDTKAAKVNIVAHSQGGLDARYAISKLGIASSVASLSMLSTPNYGSPIADLALKDTKNSLSKLFLNLAFGSMASVSNTSDGKSNDTTAALKALSADYMKNTFNPNTPDVSGVMYQSWAARTGTGSKDRIKESLILTERYLKKQAGENDGMVPVSSAKWGEFRGVIDADHLDIGGTKMGDSGPDQFDHLKFLDGLLKELRTKGM